MRRIDPIWLFGLAWTALFAAVPARAQETGPYGLVGSGFSIVGRQDARFGTAPTDAEYDDAGLADVSLGWRVLPNFRMEANVNYRQHHISDVRAEHVQGFAVKGDLHVLGALANLIVDYPLGEQVDRDSIPFAIPYAGVGVGMLWTKPRAELRLSPEQKVRGDDTQFAWNVLLGVDIPITRRVGLQFGYRYLEALDPTWELKVGGGSAGDVDAAYLAHEGRVGLRFGY